MNEWYTNQRATQLQQRAARYLWIILGVAAVTLAGCIFLCTQVNTGNASRLLGLTIGLSALGGWAVMLLIAFGQRPAKAEAGHIRGLLDAPEEHYTGTLTVSKEGFQIPGSVVVRKARLQTEEEPLTLNLNSRFASRMPAPGTPVRVTVKKKFITHWEVVE